MKPPPNDVDKFGFPIPSKFEDDPKLKHGAPRSVRQRARAVMLLLLVILVGAVVMESGVAGQARRMASEFFASQAVHRYVDGDLPGALSKLDWAVWAYPDAPRWYELRGRWRREAKDLTGSLADFTKMIELEPQSADGYLHRSFVHQRLGQTTEALADLDEAVKFHTAGDPNPLNARAYGRALAGVKLDEALIDIEQALEFSSPENSAYGSYLDTRGFIHHLLGDQKKALADLDKAIDQSEKFQDDILKRLERRGESAQWIAHTKKDLQEILAVMYHHRGLVHQKLGHAQQASDDLKRGEEWGYNPAEGVF